MPPTVEITPERAQDHEAIAAIHCAAFNDSYEAAVVAGLRAGGFAIASLVSRVDGRVAGHVMFSRMTVLVDGRDVPAAALAPLAVDENWRQMGLGGRLVETGIEAARSAGMHCVVVLGNPQYYRRFGFSLQAMAHLRTPYGPGKLMALELLPGALAGTAGEVRYPAPFGRAQG